MFDLYLRYYDRCLINVLSMKSSRRKMRYFLFKNENSRNKTKLLIKLLATILLYTVLANVIFIYFFRNLIEFPFSSFKKYVSFVKFLISIISLFDTFPLLISVPKTLYIL